MKGDITKITINALRYECSKELKNNLKNIQQLQQEDMRISKVIQALGKGGEYASEFRMNNGIIYQKTPEGDKIYLPIERLKTLIWECHSAYGYTGADRNHKIIREHFYYPRLTKIIRQTLRTCSSCQRNKIPTTSSTIIQESVQPKEPLELISIDFFWAPSKNEIWV